MTGNRLIAIATGLTAPFVGMGAAIAVAAACTGDDAMKPPEFLRDSFARSHVAKHEDYLIQDCVRTMLDEYAREREERDAMRRGRLTESGRAALMHVVAGLVIAAVVVAAAVYLYRAALAAAIPGVAP